MSSSAIRQSWLPSALVLLVCAACVVKNGKAPTETPHPQTMTVIVYLNRESEAVRTWEDEGKRAPNEIRLEFDQDGSIGYWWNSVEPMPMTDGETESLFWAISTRDLPEVTLHIFIGDSPASRLSHLLALASKAASGSDRSLIIKNQFVSCGPSGL